ncbi:hypothetical protein [uncultured Clostridium sp.]|jgi:hypothetical protein|uniref:hypothetical protein n=1 Tax=uncultured Clostridium sp. TaxID=59620 RepID=UPI002629D299|nr:hypothetical protein [uncultured Clostridium sp.]
MNDLTVNDILDEREVGSIVPLLVEIQGEDIPIFFVKDYKEVLDIIKENELIALKNSIIGTDDCILFLLMFKFAQSFETTYDVWFNYGELWHQEFLDTLKKSDRIIIDFRDENNERIKSIEMENTVSNVTQEYIDKCNESVVSKGLKDDNIISLVKRPRYETWDIEVATDLLENMFESYETIEDLWSDLE